MPSEPQQKLSRNRFRRSTVKNMLDATMSVSAAANGGRLWEGEGFGVVYWADQREGMSGIIAQPSDVSGGRWPVEALNPFPLSTKPAAHLLQAHSAMPGKKY